MLTSDPVSRSLLTLTASIAAESGSQVVTIPTVTRGSTEVTLVELVIGVGTHLMSTPCEWDGEEPDMGDSADWLQLNPAFPRFRTEPRLLALEQQCWDDGYDGFIDLF